MTRLDALVKAIAHMEGFGRPGVIPTRLCNPGDLMFAHQRYAKPHPIVGADGKTRVYAEFPTVADGLFALAAQIRIDAARGESLAQFVGKYAPEADGNDTRGYLAYVMRVMAAADPRAILSPATLLRDAIDETSGDTGATPVGTVDA